jgi:hypothetical protein
MIGRLNHVAIATKNIAAAAKVYRDTLGANVSEPVPQPDHGVTRSSSNCRTPRSSCWSRWARIRRSRNSSRKILPAACITSATRWTTSMPRAIACGGRRHHHRHRRAAHRSAWQARDLPASQGFRGHPGRARTGVSHALDRARRSVLHLLVSRAADRHADRREDAARERETASWRVPIPARHTIPISG